MVTRYQRCAGASRFTGSNPIWYAELTARYKTTVLGVLWFIANPVLMLTILVIDVQTGGRPLHSKLPGFRVVGAVTGPLSMSDEHLPGQLAVTRASGLVKRVRIPREFVPMSALMAGLVHFLISLLLFETDGCSRGSEFHRW